jgi:hypothetical protein
MRRHGHEVGIDSLFSLNNLLSRAASGSVDYDVSLYSDAFASEVLTSSIEVMEGLLLDRLHLFLSQG